MQGLASGEDWAQPWGIQDLARQCHSWPVLAVQLQVSKLDLETSTGPFQPALWGLYDPLKGQPLLRSPVLPGSAKSDTTPDAMCYAKTVGLWSGSCYCWLDETEKSLHCCQRKPLEAILILETPEEASGLFFMTHRLDEGRSTAAVGLQG